MLNLRGYRVLRPPLLGLDFVAPQIEGALGETLSLILMTIINV